MVELSEIPYDVCTPWPDKVTEEWSEDRLIDFLSGIAPGEVKLEDD